MTAIARKLGSFRWLYLSFVWAVILFVLLPLATTVWVAFFSNKIMSFPPEGYTGVVVQTGRGRWTPSGAASC